MPRKSRIPMPKTASSGAAIYLRVSTDDQARDGYGLEVQRARCLAMATAKGWTVAPEHIFSDEGISGTKPAAERPALAQLLQAVAAGQVRSVIVLALDRLGRRTAITLDLVERLTSASAELISCKESLDTSTPAGRFVVTMFAALAQLERDNIVDRTTAGRNARGSQDGEKGGRLPYGYLRSPAGIEVDAAAAVVVRRIVAADRRGLSLRAIAASLTADGIPTPQGGSAWYAGTISTILSNRAIYRGGRRGESAAHWPAILAGGIGILAEHIGTGG